MNDLTFCQEKMTYFFKVDLRICAHPSLTDEVNDPFLTFIMGQIQSLR